MKIFMTLLILSVSGIVLADSYSPPQATLDSDSLLWDSHLAKDMDANTVDTVNNYGTSTGTFAGLSSSDLVRRAIYFDRSLADSVPSNAIFDSMILVQTFGNGAGVVDDTFAISLYKINSAWIEIDGDSAVSWQFRTEAIDWTIHGGDITQISVDSFLIYAERALNKNFMRAYDSAGNFRDSTAGTVSQGFSLSLKMPVSLAECMHDGTCYGWMFRNADEDVTLYANRNINLYSTEQGTESSRPLITYYYHLPEEGPPNKVHSGRIHGSGGSSRIHGKPPE